MGESLWVDAHQALKDVFTLHMGPESDYDDLRLNHIVATVLMDQSEWDRWAADGKLPALIVEGRRAIVTPGPFGDGQIHLGKEYPFLIGIITQGDEEQSVMDAMTLLKRAERALLTEQTLALTSDDGETVQRVQIGNAMVNRAPRLSSENTWFAIGALELSVEAIV